MMSTQGSITMSTTSLFASLAVVAITIGSLHSLAPDHWVPIAAVARARNWSTARAARVAFICGLGHVTVSVVLGLLALIFGTHLFQSLGEQMVSVAGLLLIGFGVAYAIWGLRGALAHRLHGHHGLEDGHHHHHHRHDHYDHVHDASQVSTWSLFLIYCADPCVAVIPILFAAAPLTIAPTISIVVAYEIATVGAMVVLVALAHSGAQMFKSKWVERYGDSAAGALIVATGVLVAVLDW
jgi:nickel/cobalt transporter (NicO) family protein